ncbi:hypothetical protein MBM_05459 [Drepanopeziza brunnea f. sp. 'multigermtubi' MB_m1]|uniref:Uncharacterized protein n=1 Tax=Marssonina brunnea f. sp. multigermtubi (strain MB_m1) TaxID=1072389 RepID=K1WFG9_MARBU|nr:uncharacterized protein MBM_05459 [Drepanopeziza brunnea f. sp. 'multigermtubi' MB_m1]EKD16165.1 hypothetical protein MBM_05459 [Drepanopeziza brunnea f. sp. 'multigermtubi' MB_m1]
MLVVSDLPVGVLAAILFPSRLHLRKVVRWIKAKSDVNIGVRGKASKQRLVVEAIDQVYYISMLVVHGPEGIDVMVEGVDHRSKLRYDTSAAYSVDFLLSHLEKTKPRLPPKILSAQRRHPPHSFRSIYVETKTASKHSTIAIAIAISISTFKQDKSSLKKTSPTAAMGIREQLAINSFSSGMTAVEGFATGCVITVFIHSYLYYRRQRTLHRRGQSSSRRRHHDEENGQIPLQDRNVENLD